MALSNLHPAKIAEAVWPHWSEGVRMAAKLGAKGMTALHPKKR
jgi:hypothetical protein